jgi:hypothetical protein
MMFQGSKHTGEDVHFPILEALGASAVNGTTNSDRTNYFETVPSHELETALWLESDRMGYLLDSLTEKSMKNQVDVVRNERRQRYDNVAYGQARFAVAAALYPEGHPIDTSPSDATRTSRAPRSKTYAASSAPGTYRRTRRSSSPATSTSRARRSSCRSGSAASRSCPSPSARRSRRRR